MSGTTHHGLHLVPDRPQVGFTDPGGGVIVLIPIGDFDIAGTDLLRRSFASVITPASPRVVLDLSRTTFLDSMALGTVIGAARRAQGWGGWLRLVAPRRNVASVLAVSGLDQVLEIYVSQEEAMATGQTPRRLA